MIVELFDRIAAGQFCGRSPDFRAREIRGRRGSSLGRDVAADGDAGRTPVNASHAPGATRTARAPRQGVWWRRLGGARVQDVIYRRAARLGDPARRTTRPGRGDHLLSMIACATCVVARSLPVIRGRAGREYRCRCGGQSGQRRRARGLVSGDMLDWLTKPENLPLLAPADDGSELEAARAGSPVYERSWTTSPTVWGGVSCRRRWRPDPSRRSSPGCRPWWRRRLAVGAAGATWPARRRRRAAWKLAPMSAKREVARLLLDPTMLGQLRVQRIGPGRRVPVRERIAYR